MTSKPMAAKEQDIEVKFMKQIERTVEPTRFDLRDPWPVSTDAYTPSKTLFQGTFSTTKTATVKDLAVTSANGSDEIRACVIKTIKLRHVFTLVADESNTSKRRLQPHSRVLQDRLERMLRRTVMEVLILNRCRHENLLHAHATFVDVDGLHIVTPRFHSLRNLIAQYREKHNAEPIPMTVIGPILRQLCRALQYLHSIGIVHRDIQPEHILLTRNGTVKLANFGQSKPICTEKMKRECRSPTGAAEYMCAEMQHNRFNARTLDAGRSYAYDADIWSIGVLILAMVCYFPDEKVRKLPKNFAIILDEQQMPFEWLTSDMVQLRSRLTKSGGKTLKSFLNECLLTPDASRRLSAAQLLTNKTLLHWCSASISDDKKHLKKHFIEAVDFSNRTRVPIDRNNFDSLESKNIPAWFYWDDSWKIIESAEFSFKILTNDGADVAAEHKFQFSQPEPLLAIILALLERELLGWADVIAIHADAYLMAVELVRQLSHHQKRKESITHELRTSRVFEPCETLNGTMPASLILQMAVTQQPTTIKQAHASSDTPNTSSFNASA